MTEEVQLRQLHSTYWLLGRIYSKFSQVFMELELCTFNECWSSSTDISLQRDHTTIRLSNHGPARTMYWPALLL